MKKFEYYIWVQGLYGRNRSIKSQVFDLVKDLDKPKPAREVLEMAAKKIREINLRGKAAIRVCEQPYKLTIDNGIRISEYAINLGTPRKFLFNDVVEDAEKVRLVNPCTPLKR